MKTTESWKHNSSLKVALLLLGIPLVILLAQGFSSSSDRGPSLEDPEAQYSRALMYFQGEEVPRDDKEAVRWFKKAAEQGHAPSQYFLAHIYFIGVEGVAPDRRESERWLKKALRN